MYQQCVSVTYSFITSSFSMLPLLLTPQLYSVYILSFRNYQFSEYLRNFRLIFSNLHILHIHKYPGQMEKQARGICKVLNFLLLLYLIDDSFPVSLGGIFSGEVLHSKNSSVLWVYIFILYAILKQVHLLSDNHKT